MNLHEYQGKEILSTFGVKIQKGIVVNTTEDAVAAAKKLTEETGTGWHVLKAQVHAGGRGKGGGVKLAKNLGEVETIADQIIGMQLITPQTSAEGKKVHQLLVAEDVYYPGETETSEFYISVLLNRTTGRNMIMYSTEGGMDIETVAEETPEKILRATIDPFVGAQPFQGRELAFKLGLEGAQIRQFANLFMGLAKLFEESDCSLLEINPLVVTTDGNIHCLDAKINIDGNALYRQSAIAAMNDPSQEDEREAQAAEYNLNYVALEGNIGCMVNGAGLAMGTMDLVKLHGGNPANFLDVGGGATKEAVSEAFKIILSDKAVKAVLINIFGGIVSCATIAEGIIGAVQEVGVEVPVVVRFEGNNSELGRKTLADSGLNIIPADSLVDAAEKAVAAAGGKS